ncbi:MarR family winged helix-turn-helix transcriptional regulator [Actinospongicola halichondriae]|uniref:MarR family winged helix-turn-helix transcriptional regulator n=1 Tax=Actinospongicola halichondriae TaxID=3236844 RepID=UPI003D45EDF9
MSASLPHTVDVARLRLAIVRLARRQRQQSGTGLTPSLQSALAIVDVRGPLTLGELAAVERVSPPTITRIVAKLEEMGLVSRTSDPADGRVTRVDVTNTGREQLAESRVRRDAWLRDRLEELPPSDVEALVAAIGPLERLLAAADEPGDRP